jgi:ribosomal protein S18 acetylase RimI-like enzyme
MLRRAARRRTMDAMEIRDELKPGDVGAIIALHARVYAAEHALDRRFEAGLARTLGGLVLDGFPRPHEGLWIADDAGAVRGSLALSDEGDGLGRVRFFVLDPAARGQGLGRTLLSALMDRVKQGPYDRLELTTFAALRTAAHLYRGVGFTRASVEPYGGWGPVIEMERYELAL